MEIDPRVAEREARLGLERVYETDLLWHYAPRANTPEYEWRGAFLWRYDGQVTYSDEPPPEEGPTVYTEPDSVLTGPEFDPETYYFGERYDRYGRRWVVEDFDLDAIEAELAAVEVDGEDDAVVDPFTIPGVELNPDAGTEYLVELTGWDIQECPAGTRSIFTHNGNGPITEVADADYSVLDEKVVFVQVGTLVCSGAVVGPNAVLTAAHCVTDANHEPYLNPIDVCTHENLEVHNPDGIRSSCHEAIEILPCPQWANSTTYSIEHDYALVFLEHDISDETGTLILNEQTDGQINGREDRILGFSQYEDDGNCTENWEDDNCLTPSNERPGRELWTASGDIQSTPAGWIKWDTSFGRGMSGAPHLTCTNNTQPCTDGNTRVSGIQASHEMCNNPPCGAGWAGGPKGKDIKGWVNGHKNDFPPDPEPCPTPDEAALELTPPVVLANLDPELMSPTCADPNGDFRNESVCGDILVYGGTLGPPAALDPCGAAAGTMKEELVVFLPGLNNEPAENGHVLAMAAYAGYRTIGLSYANFENSNNWCIDHMDGLHDVPPNPDNSFMDCFPSDYRDECPYWARKEHITGINHPETDKHRTPAGVLLDYYNPFPVEDSLAYRLYYALAKLHRLDQQTSGGQGFCGWDTFFDDNDGTIELALDPNGLEFIDGWGNTAEERMGAIAWDKIILAGFSNGANDTGLIALENQVAGIFVIDAPTDLCLTVPGDLSSGRAATFYTALVDDVVEPSTIAPRFGVYHRDAPAGPSFEIDPPSVDPDGEVIEARPVCWNAYEVGTGADREEDHLLSPLSGLMMAECEDQVWDAEVERTEIGGPATGAPLLKLSTNRDDNDALKFRTMTIRTDQIPPDGCEEHGSLAVSGCMPVPFSDGIGTDDDATTPAQANLFEAYVTAFCELGEGQ